MTGTSGNREVNAVEKKGSKKQGEPDAKLKKEIGLWTLVALGAGRMIGSGIFALPAVMGAASGPALLLAILAAAIVMMFLAMAYAELGAAFPLTGGPYSLPRLALGDTGGFVMGWGYFLYAFIGTGAIIQIFIVYVGFWVPGLSNGQTLTWFGTAIAVLFLWVFTVINLFGVKWGGMFGLITSIGRIIPLAVFVAWGLLVMQTGNFTPFAPFGLAGITVSVTLFVWSFTGFEAVVIPTGEVKNPARTIPWAMFLTMLIATVAYLLIAFAFVGMIDWHKMGLSVGDWAAIGKLAAPLADVAKGIGLPILAIIVIIGAIIATGGTGGDWVLFQGRIPYAMADDDLFWKPMAKVHHRFGTPFNSLIFASVLTTIILVAVKSFPSVAVMASITALVPDSAAALSVPILRKTAAGAPRPFKLPVGRTVGILGFIFSTWLIYWAAWPWTMVGSVLMLLGFPLFLFVRKPVEWRRNAWIAVYLLGIVLISAIGDPKFVSQNFTGFTPLGYLKMPYDMVVLFFFALAIAFWAIRTNQKYEPTGLPEESKPPTSPKGSSLSHEPSATT